MFYFWRQTFLRQTMIGMVFCLLLISTEAFGVVLDLDSGDVVGGIIVERNDEWIKIDTGLGIPITYYLDEIIAIDGEPTLPPVEIVETPEPVDQTPAAVVPPPEPVEEIPEIVEPQKPVVSSVPEEVDTPAADQIIKMVEPDEPVEEAIEVLEIPEEPAEEEIIIPAEPTEPVITIEATKVPISISQTEIQIDTNPGKEALERPQSAPAKDIATLDGVELFKEEVSPAAIKPKEASTPQPLVIDVFLKEDFPIESKPKNERIKVLSQKVKKYFQARLTQFEHIQERIQRKGTFIKERLYAIPLKIRRAIMILGIGSLTFLYFVVCLPLMVIARKLRIKYAWLIWIPIVQVFYFVHMAKRPVWLTVFLFIPILNIILLLLFFMNILNLLKKPRWLILFLIIPGINIFTLWYLAISKTV